VEGFGLVGAGGFIAIETAVSRPADVANALAVAMIAAGTGVLLAWLARALARLRGWARTPTVVLQVLFLTVGVPLVAGGQAMFGLPVLVLAGTVLYLLFTPESRLALG